MTAHMIMLQSGGAVPIIASASPESLSVARFGPGSATTTATTVTASGGLGGPYSYTWTRIAGDPQISANSPSSATTAFTATLGFADYFLAEFTCTVTDSSGSGISNSVAVDIGELS